MAGTCDLKGTAHYNKIESDPFEWRRQAEVREQFLELYSCCWLVGFFTVN